MMNIIRADVYRIFRGWGVWVVFGLAALIPAAMIIASYIAGEITNVAYDAPVFSAAEGLSMLMLFLVLLAVPVFTITAGPVFQDKTVKNEVSWGVPRTTLYLSRMIVAALWCVLLVIVYYGVGMALFAILTDSGNQNTLVANNDWGNFFISAASQTFMVIASSWLGIFLTFIIKNPFVTIEVYGGILIIPQMFGVLLGFADVDVTRVMYFDLTSNLAYLHNVAGMESNRFAIAMAVGAVWAFIPAIIGLINFQRREIS